MGVLIDASVLIAHERGRLDLDRLRSEGDQDAAYLSAVTASELLHGVHRATTTAIRHRRGALVDAFLSQWSVLPIDMNVARAHARLWAELAKAGSMIGIHDSWLAATCIAHGLRIATSNVREFKRVPGLDVEDWSQPVA